MTKHLTNNSVLKRASLFENLNHDQSNRQRDNVSDSSKEMDSFQDSIKANLTSFKNEYNQLFPNSKLPFIELNSIEEVKQLMKSCQERIEQLQLEVKRNEFVASFFGDILALRENDSAIIVEQSNNNNNNNNSSSSSSSNNSLNDHTTKNDKMGKNNSIVSKEQYVTVITLNDSTYGEIQKQKPTPKSIFTINQATTADGRDPKNDDTQKIEAALEPSKESSKDNKVEHTEPIYLNTLETQKPQEKAPKKRPPTPPRKPKFNNASLKLKSLKNDAQGDTQSGTTGAGGGALAKSDSLSSIQPTQRKFSGPKHQVDSSTMDSQKKEEVIVSVTKSNSDSHKENSKHTFLRTFSVEQHSPTIKSKNDEQQTLIDRLKPADSEGALYKDYDNIYDTVAPDSDCDIDSNDDSRNLSTRDDETNSSHEMLSRSSSTDEGLSDYVNIDYFLCKNSLGRSNSNIPNKLSKYPFVEDEPEDNETNLSSMRSSDYDQFSSNENLLNSLQQPATADSFNSISTKSSTSVSSLRAHHVKPLNTDIASSYPPNLSTFSPLIQERNQPIFFNKDSSTPNNDVSPISHKDSSTDSLKKGNLNSSAEYYAYTDILDSLPKSDQKMMSETKVSDGDLVPKIYDQRNIDQSMVNVKHSIIRSIIDSETVYLDCLKTLIQYKNAFSTTTSSGENALLSEEDLNTIFYRIPELYRIHETFLNGLRQLEHKHDMELMSTESIDGNRSSQLNVGELFRTLAYNISIYSDFLRNYSNSIVTANRCSANNSKFSELIKSIKIASLNGQFTNLVDLLHKPVARLQKNDLVLYDLIKNTDPRNEEEFNSLNEALKMSQEFLQELNFDKKLKSFCSIQDKFQRRLVKESFIVENSERRKLRHLFLFNDVIACAKYKASSKQKFTFELKWFQMLNDIVLEQDGDILNTSTMSSSSSYSLTSGSTFSNNNSNSPQVKDGSNIFQWITQLKLRASSLRCDMMAAEKRKQRKYAEKLRKKISEVESELLLCLPQLKFSFYPKSNPSKVHTFFLSSEFERTTWIEAIKRMQLQVSLSSLNTDLVSFNELQFDSFTRTINPNLGSFLLRSNKDESLRFGDLYIRVKHFKVFNNRLANIFFVFETDSYGHFFRCAVTRYVTNAETDNINQEFLVALEGAQCLRILCYEDMKKAQKSNTTEFNKETIEKSWVFKSKCTIELNPSCLNPEFIRKEIIIKESILFLEMKYISLTSTMERIPPNKIVGNFGINISQVCKKEKSKVPYLILCCINEVERRGLKEVGIYRVSGLSSDIQRLKKVFESSPRDGFWIIRETDINAVTGLLKLYLRELPESLFTNDMFTKYLEAKDNKNLEEKDKNMTTLLSQLKEPNQSTVIALIEHLILVNRFEEENKMSLNNLATVFGPTMLRTNTSNSSSSNNKHFSLISSNANQPNANQANPNFSLINSDLFTASTIDVMAQADILYFFLRRKHQGFSLTSIEREETCL